MKYPRRWCEVLATYFARWENVRYWALFVVVDELHSEIFGEYPTLEDALAILRLRAEQPWDEDPNRTPCKSWRTCGRQYVVREYCVTEPARCLNRTPVLEVSSEGSKWLL